MLVACLQLSLSMIMVGAVVALAKPLLAVLPMFVLVTLRQVIAVATLGGWMAVSGRSMAPPPRDVWRLLLLQIFFGNFLFNVLLLSGLQRTGAIEAGLITSTLPAAVALLAWRMLGEHITTGTRVAVVLAIGGVALLEASGAQDADGSSLLGDLLVFGAVIAEALYTIYARKLAGRVEPLHATLWANVIALVLYLPFLAATMHAGDMALLTPSLWGWLVVYALMSSVLSFWLWYRGTARVPAAKAGLFTGLVPLTAVGIGAAVLGEQLTTAHAAGALLLLGSLVLAVRRA